MQDIKPPGFVSKWIRGSGVSYLGTRDRRWAPTGLAGAERCLAVVDWRVTVLWL